MRQAAALSGSSMMRYGVRSSGDAADLLLAADQNGLRDPQTARLLDGEEHVVVLRAGNGKALCALRTGRRAERFDGFDHRNPPIT